MMAFSLGGSSLLPNGWCYATAGNFCQKRSATFNPTVATGTAYELWSIPGHADGLPEIVDTSDIGSNKQFVAPGDVLISKINPRLNRTWVVKDQGEFPQIASTEWMVFPRSEAFEPHFLAMLLSDHRIRDFLSANASGVGGSLTRARPALFDKIQIPVPPLNEQRRIVERIEALFEEIDRGVESLRTAKSTLDLYRKSLLKSAFEGRLTADWRAQNPDKLESPDLLLARIREEREARYQADLDKWEQTLAKWKRGGEKRRKPRKPKRPRYIPAKATDIGVLGWTLAPLGLLIDAPTYGTSKKCDYGAGAKGVLRIPNIGLGRIDPTDLKSADFDEAEVEQYRLIEGDVLTVRSNGSLTIVGKPALVNAGDTEFLFAGYLIRLRPIFVSLVPKNLVYLMIDPRVRAQIEAKAKSTSGVNNISAKELQELIVPICSCAEQSEIARILDARLEAAEMLEAEIDANLARAEALRQSLLKKAFAGQLVPQDPDDEPAATLLARIRTADSRTPARKRKMRVEA